MGLLDFEEGAVQRKAPGHCFSKYDQELFTRKNTGVEVNWSGEKGAQRLCPLTGLFSKGRRLERDLEGPY